MNKGGERVVGRGDEVDKRGRTKQKPSPCRYFDALSDEDGKKSVDRL